jgi:hypothetical protein
LTEEQSAAEEGEAHSSILETVVERTRRELDHDLISQELAKFIGDELEKGDSDSGKRVLSTVEGETVAQELAKEEAGDGSSEG